MKTFGWACPYCCKNATISDHNYSESFHLFNPGNAEETRFACSVFVTCPNLECGKYTLDLYLLEANWNVNSREFVPGNKVNHWELLPTSKAKIFPAYIPEPIIEDYNEACSIVMLSPKASATLSRRCLQGIIRDYWGVKPANLINEIEEIKDKIDSLTWGAIDAVRKVGNVGAHMEKDINVIIDVDSNEAELLIGLIETLIEEWYIGREERQKRLNNIISMAETKKNPLAMPISSAAT